jgi:membrane protein required for colicin V production
MNPLDIAILIIFIIFALSGLRKGLIREVFSLGALCVGFYVAFTFHDKLSNELPEFIKYDQIKTAVSFAALFFVIYIPLILAGRGFRRLVKNIKLGWLDKILGLAFGALKGLAVCCIGVFILLSFLTPKNKLVAQSKLTPQLISISKKFMLKGQDFFENSFDMKKLDELEQMLQNRDSGKDSKGFKHISVPQPPAKIKT